jgi:thiol-disulfide isomerase/thioredoxin
MPLAGFFFRAPPSAAPDTAANAGAPSAKTQALLEELQKLDAAADKAVTPAEQTSYNARRADILQQLAADAGAPADRAQWIRQLADTVSAAVQSGRYPDGVTRLADLFATLSADATTRELAAYVRFRHLTAEYGVAIQAPKVNFQDVQTKWLESLEQYIKEYPESPDTADAMLQLAIAQEFAGEEDEAKKWYGQIVARFPDSEPAKKAAGAKLRLESVGRMIALRGTTVAGGKFDLQRDFKGKIVLLHYWATWCEPAVNDLDQLKELQAKYGKMGFTPVGVSLDGNKEELADFLKKNRLNWPQVYEPGSLDSRLAQELGILTLPTMILIDKSGKVISRNISIAEIEPELKRQLR